MLLWLDAGENLQLGRKAETLDTQSKQHRRKNWLFEPSRPISRWRSLLHARYRGFSLAATDGLCRLHIRARAWHDRAIHQFAPLP
jgi:hypothetical protein